jgi:hypothetical protein
MGDLPYIISNGETPFKIGVGKRLIVKTDVLKASTQRLRGTLA